MENNILEKLQEEISCSDYNESTKKDLYEKILTLKNQKVNLMIAGATGCGKSSTINALFNLNVAKIGIGTDPETMDIERYDLENLILWDTPGLGDGLKDEQHSKNIKIKLEELDEHGDPLIDLVLVILDGSSRDYGTSFTLINDVIIPSLGDKPNERILVAINQCDMAMKGRHWNHRTNAPEEILLSFLDEKVTSVKDRIKESTDVLVEPIYYSAGFVEEAGDEQKPYNLSKLLYFIVKGTPSNKRLNITQNINQNKDNFVSGEKGFLEKVGDAVMDGIAGVAAGIGNFFRSWF